MIVCLIAEGSYPYISGGVSSWIHQLITGLPNIQFKVLSIMPSRKEKIKSRYPVPENLLVIETIFLDDYLLRPSPKRIWPSKARLTTEEKETLKKLIGSDSQVDWAKVIKIISGSRKVNSIPDFLQSPFFWETVVELYQDRYSSENFNTFFWTLRAMLLPFLSLLQTKPIDADIYHAVSTGYAGILGASFQELTGKPFVLTEHGIYAREREEEIIKANWVTGIYKKLWIDFFYFLSRVAYKEADKIITLFKGNQEIQRQLGAPEGKLSIISNGVKLTRYDIEREEHDNFLVGAILRIVPIKDVMTLIRAFKIVHNKIPHARLYLIGPTDEDTEYFEQCKSLIQMLNIEKKVIFTGTVDVTLYLKKLDVVVLTSISEGQPLVILEAMASGLPVVATNVGSCQELLTEGPAGIVTNLASPNETANALLRLWEEPSLRYKMGRSGKQRVRSAYSEELFLTSYENTYKDLRWLSLWLELDLH